MAIIDVTGNGRRHTDLTTSGSGKLQFTHDTYADDSIILTGDWDRDVTIHGGDDIVVTGSGNDTIADNPGGNRILQAFNGETVLVRGPGPSGDDTVFAGAGNDTVTAGDGVNLYNGEADIDTIDYSRASFGVRVNLREGTGQGDGTDTLVSIENVVGSRHNDFLMGSDESNHLNGREGNDTLDGLAGRDTLAGGDGDDVLRGGAGGDRLDGGEGIDTISYVGSSQGVIVDLGGRAVGGDARGDTFVGVENIRGSSHGDGLTGDAGNNVLIGGAGRDVLAGGEGDDRFVFELTRDSTVDNPDRIIDFTQGADTIDLALLGAVFTGFEDGRNSRIQAPLTLVDRFTGQDGQVDIVIGATNTMVFVDLDGDKRADFSLELAGRIDLNASDFIL